MFPAESKKGKGKKSRKSSGGDAEPDEPLPVDVLVDTLIGFLEQATAYMRAVANQVFTLLSGSVQESTIDLILAVCIRTAVFLAVVGHCIQLSLFAATGAEDTRGAGAG